MTKEELEKEVLEYLNTQTLPKVDSLVYRVIKNLILGFAEPREKRIEELEQQIEKMKCCSNCFYDCEDCNSKNKDCDKCPCGTCVKHNHWESRR